MRLIDRSRSNATEAHHTVVNNYDIAENTNSQTTTFAELKNRQGESLGINPEDTIYWSFANLFGSYHGSLKGSNLLRDLASDINDTAGFSAISYFGTNSSYRDRFNNLHDNGGNFAISVYDYDLVTGFTLNVVDSQGNVNKFANRNLKFDDDVIQMEIPTGQLIWQQANCYRALSFQVGSEANQATKFDMGDLRALVIGLTHYSDEITGQDKINISTKEDANLAIDILDKTINKVLRHQTSIGAYLARLEHTASNLTTILTSDQASESTIRDADMAKEMTNYMKNNLLVQSSKAMFAQANQEPLTVMALLNDETAA